MKRRTAISTISSAAIAAATGGLPLLGCSEDGQFPGSPLEAAPNNPQPDSPFRVWVYCCAHIWQDLRHGRESLADAIRQSEFGGAEGGPPFEWDIGLNLGDLASHGRPPDDEEGALVRGQYDALVKHRREQIYDIAGNHDASGPTQATQWWFKRWVDPFGQRPALSNVHNERRPFPVEGEWEHYSFRVGNLLFLMMSDRNDGGPPAGRGPMGGYPAGAVKKETFHWWRKAVEANPDCVVITAHHHLLCETTVATGPWEGFRRRADGTYVPLYHGYYPDGGPKGASYLYFLDNEPDLQTFEHYLASSPGSIDLWLGGHTHTDPDDVVSGRSHIERKWGVGFVNCAALTRYHQPKVTVPMSRLFTFTPGSSEVRVQCYLHTSQYAPQGWYAPAERVLPLRHPFAVEGASKKG